MSNTARSLHVPVSQTNLARHEYTLIRNSYEHSRIRRRKRARRCTNGKEVVNEQATRGRTILSDKTEVDDGCADGNGASNESAGDGWL